MYSKCIGEFTLKLNFEHIVMSFRNIRFTILLCDDFIWIYFIFTTKRLNGRLLLKGQAEKIFVSCTTQLLRAYLYNIIIYAYSTLIWITIIIMIYRRTGFTFYANQRINQLHNIISLCKFNHFLHLMTRSSYNYYYIYVFFYWLLFVLNIIWLL